VLGGINVYNYPTDPLGWVDPRGLKVVFAGKKKEELERIWAQIRNSDPNTSKNCKTLEESSKTITITSDPPPGAPRAGQSDKLNMVVVDPTFHPDTQTTNGIQPAPTDVILVHEVGHAATGTKDDGPGNMNNVNQNENPYRVWKGYPERTKY
jgi:hypothetical protein